MSTRSFQPGDAYGCSFTTKAASGALANADATPAGTLYRNGSPDGAVAVTVAGTAVGVYSASCTIPGAYAVGDRVSLLVAATIGGVATGEFIDHARLVGYPNNALPNAAAGAGAGVPTAAGIATAVLTDATDIGTAGSLGALIGTVNANLDAKVSSRNAGNVTVGGYAAGQDPATLVWAANVRTLSAFGFSVTVGTNNDKSGYSLSATPPTSAVVAAAVWDLATAGHATSGSFGSAMVAAGSASDPWSTALPGSYGAGTAGALLAAAATTLPAGKVVAGSSASVVILSGLPAGSNFLGQRIGPSNAEYRTVVSHTYAGGNYTLTLGTGVGEAGPFSATPATDAVLTMGP